MISAQQVAVVVNDKQSLHDSLRRNQLYCPKLKEGLMTVQFMKGCIKPHVDDLMMKYVIVSG